MMSFPENCSVNHHAFWVIFKEKQQAVDFMAKLREHQVAAYIGYIPLHSSPMGQKLGYREDDLPLTEDLGNRIVRMPFYTELAENGLEHCISSMQLVLNSIFE
jgi:dTDP-4-amino-4,6-dideoxygalactose transaminase